MDKKQLKEEKLSKELKSCIEDCSSYSMIKHHFVNTMYTSDPDKKDWINWRMNEICRQKKIKYSNYLMQNDFESMLSLIEGPWKVDCLYRHREKVMKNSGECLFYELLGDVITGTENAHQHKSKVGKMFYLGDNPRMMMNAEELIEFNDLPESLKVWRGVNKSDECKVKDLISYSWTLDYDTASWFANRNLYSDISSPLVFGLEINKEDVLAYFTRRDEKEIVIDPKKINLGNVEFIYP